MPRKGKQCQGWSGNRAVIPSREKDKGDKREKYQEEKCKAWKKS